MINIICILLIAVLTGVDQLIKYFAVSALQGIPYITVIKNIVRFKYVENTGAAFSLFSQNTTALSIVTGIVILAGIIIIALGKIKSKYILTCAVMIISGGLGNLIDRILRGYVVDYIDLLFVKFAVFNFADCLVTVGAFMIIIYLFVSMFNDRKKDKENNQKHTVGD